MKSDLIERTTHLLALQQLYHSVVVISCILGWMLVASGPNPGRKGRKKKTPALVRSLDGRTYLVVDIHCLLALQHPNHHPSLIGLSVDSQIKNQLK